MPIYRILAPAQHAARPSADYPKGKRAMPAVNQQVQCGKHRVHYLADQLAGPHRAATVNRIGSRTTQRIRKHGARPQDREGRSLFAHIMASLGL